MSFRIVRTIYWKELVDTLRDKRTLIAMIGIPVVLYPGLLIAASQVALVQQSKREETVSKVVLQGLNDAIVSQWFGDAEQFEFLNVENPDAALEAREVDAIVRAPDDLEASLEANETATIRIAYDATEGDSREAMNRIVDALDKAGQSVLKSRLDERNLPAAFAEPLAVERENVAPPEKTTGTILGTILPLIMVVMLGVGAFYPAVDLTAGEKERGTFETLLSTPTSKLEIVAGKFLAVFTLAMFTGLLNLGSMTATVAFQFSQFMSQMSDDQRVLQIDFSTVAPVMIGAVVLVMVPLAFFISGVMMSVALMARSFKDAQNLVTPFFMAIIMPAMLVAIPDIELNASTQFVPIGNVTLLFRDLLKGTVGIDMVFVVFLCTAVYALLSLVLATWMFQREEVILSEEKGIPLSLNRRSFKPLDAPTPGLALGLFAVVMLLIFYVGAQVQSRDIHWGLAITQVLLILAPVLGVLWFARVNLVNALNLRWPGAGPVAGTLILSAAWFVIMLQVSVWHSRILPLPEEFEMIEQLLFGLDEPKSIWILLLVIAVLPAICEEVLFRGAIVSGLRNHVPPWVVIVTVGVLFGLFHLSIHRLIPTALSGFVLTYLAVRTRSIYPAMIAHFMLNGSMILLGSGHVPERVLQFFEEPLSGGAGLPVWLLAAAAVGFTIGIAVVERTART